MKKQSEVYLYGEFADTNHFNATKVVIALGNRGVKYEVLSTSGFRYLQSEKRENHSSVDCFDTCKQYDFRYKMILRTTNESKQAMQEKTNLRL